MLSPGSAQPRRPAGTPTGGQFASTNRPEARGIHLVEDDPSSGEHDEISRALREIEQLGAENAERMVQVGRVAAALPAAARLVVGEAMDHRRSPRDAEPDAMVAALAEITLARALHRAGTGHATSDHLLSGLSRSAMSTDLERAARFHVRQALRGDADGDTTWVCPADPSHPTRDGVCTSCGAMRAPNDGAHEQVPIEAMEPTGEDAFSGHLATGAGSASIAHGGGRLELSGIDWTACGDADEPGGEEAQLLGTVQIGSTPFHVLALQVEDNDVGQRALQRDDDLVDTMRALGDEAPYETVEVGGRSYVLLISPHAR